MAKEKNSKYEIKKISELKDKKLKDLFEGKNQAHDGRKVETGIMAENLQAYTNYLQRSKKKAS